MIKNYKLFFITVSLLLLISIIFLIVISPMKLDKKIEITDYATLIALVLTLVAAVFAFYFKNQQTELLKIQRRKDLLEIAKANENSELARKESEHAKKDAATAFENAASSNEKAAKAELKSKELELELLKLRLAVSDRYLPDFIKNELIKKLKSYSAKKVLIICNISNNAEPMNFSIELSNFFKSIGWTVEIRNSNNVMMPAPTGIKIIASGKSNLEIAQLIQNEFLEINYQSEVIKTTDANETIIIQVNSK